MKKSIFAVLGFAALLCGCSSPKNSDGASARFYVEGKGYVNTIFSYYDFTQQETGFEINGFSGREDFGRWTDGDTCSIVLNNVLPNSELTAKIGVSMAPPSGEAAKFDVFANGTYVSSFETYPGTVYANIPSAAVGNNDKVILVFTMKNPVRPVDIKPEYGDTRLLGMGVSNVTVYGYSQCGEN